jgi:predicted transcriptional regulator
MAAAKGLLRGAGAAMKPSEIRDANYEQIRATWLAAKRWDVYCAFLKHGPGTTRQVATESGIDLLTLRPRVTELCEFGFVALVEGEPRMDTNEHEGKREGVYRARTREEFEAWREEERKREAVSGQLQLI